MKIIYLLPPSEGKNATSPNLPLSRRGIQEKLSFSCKKPVNIAENATEKDLKCKGKRYEQGIELNRNLEKSELLPAIERYSGVMYNSIDYEGMSRGAQTYFENNFKILSGMYGVLAPLDTIGNYKLPIETKGLYKFWGDHITQTLNEGGYDYIVDMLPGSYARMIDWKNLNTKIVRINFLHTKDGKLKKITHGVKKIKGIYIKDLCEKQVDSMEKFEGEKVQISENEYHINIIPK